MAIKVSASEKSENTSTVKTKRTANTAAPNPAAEPLVFPPGVGVPMTPSQDVSLLQRMAFAQLSRAQTMAANAAKAARSAVEGVAPTSVVLDAPTFPLPVFENCLFKTRDGQRMISMDGTPACVTIGQDGLITFNLAGYAIVPLEEYAHHSAAAIKMAREHGYQQLKRKK